MNRSLRVELNALGGRLDEIYETIERIRDEEEEKLDNMPESLQESRRAEQFQEVVDSLDTALNAISEANEAIGDAISV